MPDYQRLIDYDGNYASWETLLRRAGLLRPPRKSCNRCYGRGFIRINGSPQVCACVDKSPPLHRIGNKEDRIKIDELAFRLREEYNAALKEAKGQN